jgi:hypothetical protein
VAWYEPIVMNTKAQLQQAIDELRSGTFIKERHQPTRLTTRPLSAA